MKHLLLITSVFTISILNPEQSQAQLLKGVYKRFQNASSTVANRVSTFRLSFARKQSSAPLSTFQIQPARKNTNENGPHNQWGRWTTKNDWGRWTTLSPSEKEQFEIQKSSTWGSGNWPMYFDGRTWFGFIRGNDGGLIKRDLAKRDRPLPARYYFGGTGS